MWGEVKKHDLPKNSLFSKATYIYVHEFGLDDFQRSLPTPVIQPESQYSAFSTEFSKSTAQDNQTRISAPPVNSYVHLSLQTDANIQPVYFVALHKKKKKKAEQDAELHSPSTQGSMAHPGV